MSKILDQNFTNLAALFEEILELRNEDKSPAELAAKRKYAMLLFVLIKKVNRNEKYKIRSGRDLLQVEKVRVDSNRLQLQNLLYEITHLKREIRRCYNFRSGDEELDLLPQENYMELLEMNAMTSDGTIKRQTLLECELKLRKKLSNEYKELLASKKQIFQDIVSKTELLASFTPSLRNLIKATVPLQTALQLPMDQEWKLQQLVQLLPKPLYVAFVNSYALESASNSTLKLAVVGSESLVNELEHSGHVVQLKEAINIALGDGDANERALKPHPLSLQYKIGNLKEGEECIVVNIRYFPSLEIVTADSKMHISDTDGDLIPPQDILKNLYQDDNGELILLDISTKLKKYGIAADELTNHLTQKEYGYPYHWLQRICGIQVFDKHAERSATKIRYNIQETLNSIKEIWSSRMNLFKQIKLLVNKNIDFFLQDEETPLVPPSCNLLQFTSIKFEDYASNSATARYVDSDFINANNILFRSVIVRGSAKMECLISISNQFPNDSPLWAICVHWNGQYNATNSTAIKVMEHWTNSLEGKDLKDSTLLLPTQLIRTMNSFDVFLETESVNHKPSEFSKEKPFIKAFAKRIRLRPYRFLKEAHINLFKQ